MVFGQLVLYSNKILRASCGMDNFRRGLHLLAGAGAKNNLAVCLFDGKYQNQFNITGPFFSPLLKLSVHG
jgi:hypothetical protein